MSRRIITEDEARAAARIFHAVHERRAARQAEELERQEHRLVLIDGDGPDVFGAYIRRGWTIDEAGRWHEPEP